ncbi:MAG TPA: carboxylesterase family protein, partial [Amycolatopsis sp.]|nr:carboxylesterase family protein [Amycolatopsis sp.]
ADLGSPALAWAAVATDRTWSCSQLIDDRLLAQRTPVFAFEFADRNAPPPFPFPPGFPPGAFHGAETEYLFDLFGTAAPLTPDQQRLADQLIRYWSRFAATGSPNGEDSPRWPRFRPSDVQSLAPGEGGIHQVDLSAEHNCDFWRSF